jgi:hypothetical protein
LVLALIDISFHPAKMDSVDRAKRSVRAGRKVMRLDREDAVFLNIESRTSQREGVYEGTYTDIHCTTFIDVALPK